MSEHPNVVLARASMDAFNRRDFEAFSANLADDVVWHAPGKNRFSGSFDGKAPSMQRFKDQAEAGVSLEFTDLHDVLGSDAHVVALLTIKVTGPGGTHEGPSVFVMHVRDGKLVEFWAMNEDQAEFDRVVEG